jgi:hypothetical protein
MALTGMPNKGNQPTQKTAWLISDVSGKNNLNLLM